MLKIINMYTKILPIVYLQEAGFWVIFLFIFVLFHLYQFLYLSCSCSSNKKCYWMNIFTYICLNSYVPIYNLQIDKFSDEHIQIEQYNRETDT